MTGGYQADPESLAQASKGINGVITELRDLGVVGTGDVGRGFSQLKLSGMDLGDSGLKDTFDTFCTRWSWGVRTLVQDGNQMGVRLGINAGQYAMMEEYAEGTFKELFADTAGNPHMTAEQAAQSSWGDIAKDATTSSDYSADSFKDSAGRMGDSWKDTAQDTLDSQSDPMGTNIEDVQKAINGDEE
jgi:hypothetical protein